MTLRERLQIIGQGIRGELPVKEIIKEVREKGISAGYLDFGMNDLSNYKKVSDKLLAANKGWVFRNNDVIAKEVAQTDFELYTVKIVKGEVVLDTVLESPLLDLLDRFNEFTTKADALYLTSSHQNLAGDSFWLLDGKGFDIKNIFLLQPDKIELELGKQAGGTRIIQAYKYQDTIDGQTIKETYDAEDVIHFKQPNPNNPYRGLSKVEAVAESIDTDNLAVEAARSMFERGMITNFVLKTDQRLTSEQRKQLAAEMRSSYQGAKNTFKIPIFSGGLTPESIQMTNRDMQFIDIQTWLRDKITAAFGNTKAVVGVTDDVNRANAEASILNWKRTTVNYEVKSIVDTINEFLVPRFGTNLILGYKDIVEDDEDEKIDRVSKLKGSDLVTINEAREMLDLDPVKGGDEFTFQRTERQIQQAPQLPKSIKNVDYIKRFRQMGIYSQIKTYEGLKKASKPIAEKILKSRKKPVIQKFINFTDEQAYEYYEKQLDIIETHEIIFQNKVEKYIERLIERAISNIPDEISDMQRKQLFDEDEELSEARAEFVPILVAVSVAARQLALQLINFDKPLINTAIEEYVTKRVNWFAKSMLQTDKDKLIDIIAQGVANGESIPSIRNTITETFATYSRSQAERVARTEVANASVQSSLDAWKESGVVEGKEWVIAGATDDCLSYSGKVVPLDEEFPEGDPPLHPNCKCSVIPVLMSEKGKSDYFKEKAFAEKVEELESQIDKRTKKYRELKAEKLEVEKYVEELEDLISET